MPQFTYKAKDRKGTLRRRVLIIAGMIGVLSMAGISYGVLKTRANHKWMEMILAKPLPDSFELLEVYSPSPGSGPLDGLSDPWYHARVDAGDLAALLGEASPAEADDDPLQWVMRVPFKSFAERKDRFISSKIDHGAGLPVSLFRMNKKDEGVGMLLVDESSSPALHLYLRTLSPVHNTYGRFMTNQTKMNQD